MEWWKNLPKIYRGPDDGAGSGGSDGGSSDGGLMANHQDDSGEGGGDAGDTGGSGGDGSGGDAGGGDGSGAGSGGDVERPEHIPEQFWNKEKGEATLEAWGKSHSDLRAEMNRLKQNGDAKAPETAEEYMKDWRMPTGEDGAELSNLRDIPEDDPIIGVFASAAHKAGLAPEAFNQILSDVLVGMNGHMPAPFDEAAELEKLGGIEQGKAVVGLNKQWLQGMRAAGDITDQELARGVSMCSDALGVQLLNKLRVGSGEKPVPVSLGQGSTGKSKAELEAMYADPLYQDPGPKGEAYREKVSKAVLEAVGTAPASSSDQVSFINS